MLTEDQEEELSDIFYAEAPFDFVLTFSKKKHPDVNGVCVYEDKICTILGAEEYKTALITLLHELAHARIQHKTHSDTWEKEFVRLLAKYNVERSYSAFAHTIIGPNIRRYIDGI